MNLEELHGYIGDYSLGDYISVDNMEPIVSNILKLSTTEALGFGLFSYEFATQSCALNTSYFVNGEGTHYITLVITKEGNIKKFDNIIDGSIKDIVFLPDGRYLKIGTNYIVSMYASNNLLWQYDMSNIFINFDTYNDSVIFNDSIIFSDDNYLYVSTKFAHLNGAMTDTMVTYTTSKFDIKTGIFQNSTQISSHPGLGTYNLTMETERQFLNYNNFKYSLCEVTDYAGTIKSHKLYKIDSASNKIISCNISSIYDGRGLGSNRKYIFLINNCICYYRSETVSIGGSNYTSIYLTFLDQNLVKQFEIPITKNGVNYPVAGSILDTDNSIKYIALLTSIDSTNNICTVSYYSAKDGSFVSTKTYQNANNICIAYDGTIIDSISNRIELIKNKVKIIK